MSLATLMASCSSTPPSGESSTVRRVTYACSAGEPVEMRYFPQQGVAVLVRGGSTIELQQQPAASGFLYTNGPTTVRGKGDELSVEIGRMAPLVCTAR